MATPLKPSPEPLPSANDDALVVLPPAQRRPAGTDPGAAGETAPAAGAGFAASPEAAVGGDPAPAAPATDRRTPLVSPALLLLVAVVAAIGWQWYDARARIGELRAELAKELADAGALNRDSRTIAAQAQELARELNVRTQALENRIGESQSQLIALDALYQQLARGGDESALAEIEQILLLAAQQLQLAGNVKAALIALQTADARLQRIERPQLAPLRKVLARDMQALAAVPAVDYTGIAMRLDQIASGVDRLALPGMAAAAPAPPATTTDSEPVPLWRRAWRALAREFRQVVTIERTDRVEPPLLAPEQSYFLRENLRLRLLAARVALLARDADSFRADVTAAHRWIEQHFDARDPAVAAALDALKPLAEREIRVEVPDLAASLDAVRGYRLTRDRPPR